MSLLGLSLVLLPPPSTQWMFGMSFDPIVGEDILSNAEIQALIASGDLVFQEIHVASWIA